MFPVRLFAKPTNTQMNIEKPSLNNTICCHLRSKRKNWLIRWISRIRGGREIRAGMMALRLALSISTWRAVARRSLMTWSLSTFFSDLIFTYLIFTYLTYQLINLFLYLSISISSIILITKFRVHFKLKQ